MKILSHLFKTGAIICLLVMTAANTSVVHAEEKPAQRIDPERLPLTFAEEFDTLELARRNKPGRKWTSGLPYSGDFGKAKFVSTPRKGFPFRLDDGVLVIEARRKWDGSWESGLLSSVDRSYNGFAQQFGYFEARMKMPTGKGTWPAFWMLGTGQGLDPFTAEIDVVEYYGGRPTFFEAVSHVWDWEKPDQHQHRTKRFAVTPEQMTEKFNTYGVLVGPEETVFFFNRQEIARFATFKEHHQPMYLLLNLALEPSTDLDQLPSPQRMYVDYVRVYEWDPSILP